MNKLHWLLALIAVSFSSVLPLAAQPSTPVADAASAAVSVPPPPAARLSPHETISLHVGSGRNAPLVTITYGRPLSKKVGTTEVRKIWGALVPWGQVWRMGSDEATTLITQVPLDFSGTTVPAGAYTLCMYPDDKGTTKLIINKQIGQWGIPYTPAIQANELARVDMKKDTLDTQVDEFTIALIADPATGGATLKAFWETTQYSVGFTVQK
jgi:hypothetical protein